MTKNEKFKEILKNINESKKNKGRIKLADLRKKSLERKEKDKKEGKKKDDESKVLTEAEEMKLYMESPLIQEGVDIAIDLAKIQ